MDGPKELSLREIRQYMLDNGCKVTNHALVKHFKRFLTHPLTQNEARKEFKTYVNILATIKNDNNQKYLILRKKYLNECPSEDVVQRAISQTGSNDGVPSSPGAVSLSVSDSFSASPYRQPPPYKPPPEVSSPLAAPMFSAPLAPLQPVQPDEPMEEPERGPQTPTPQEEDVSIVRSSTLEEKAKREKSISRSNSQDKTIDNKENIPRFSFSSGSSGTDSTDATGEKSSEPDVETENPISVKEATRKFNRMASEEEAKIISPPSKKKAEKHIVEEKELPEVTMTHPKAKEWIVAMAKGNYQELAKLANEHPELVKLQDPATGYTALHWAAKHGNEDVCKLIAGNYKADVNARTNGGYSPLHIAMQFGRSNIFELLCNTYKANRDLLDWAGNKPLEYGHQQTTVSPSTYSSEYCAWFLQKEINNNSQYELSPNGAAGKLGSGGGTVGSALTRGKKRSQLTASTYSGDSPLSRTQSLLSAGHSPLRRRDKKAAVQSVFFGKEEDSLGPLTSPQSSPDNSPRSQSPKEIREGTVARRKESFLRKTLRAATASGRSHSNNNTSNSAKVTNSASK